MIDFLYQNSGKAPVIGRPITISYISSKVKDLVSGKSSTLDPEAKKYQEKNWKVILTNRQMAYTTSLFNLL